MTTECVLTTNMNHEDVLTLARAFKAPWRDSGEEVAGGVPNTSSNWSSLPPRLSQRVPLIMFKANKAGDDDSGPWGGFRG